jgi:hypothetical protein
VSPPNERSRPGKEAAPKSSGGETEDSRKVSRNHRHDSAGFEAWLARQPVDSRDHPRWESPRFLREWADWAREMAAGRELLRPRVASDRRMVRHWRRLAVAAEALADELEKRP